MRTAPALSETALSTPFRSCSLSTGQPSTSRYQPTLVFRSFAVSEIARLRALKESSLISVLESAVVVLVFPAALGRGRSGGWRGVHTAWCQTSARTPALTRP